MLFKHWYNMTSHRLCAAEPAGQRWAGISSDCIFVFSQAVLPGHHMPTGSNTSYTVGAHLGSHLLIVKGTAYSGREHSHQNGRVKREQSTRSSLDLQGAFPLQWHVDQNHVSKITATKSLHCRVKGSYFLLSPIRTCYIA